jgi:hypothetical protein
VGTAAAVPAGEQQTLRQVAGSPAGDRRHSAPGADRGAVGVTCPNGSVRGRPCTNGTGCGRPTEHGNGCSSRSRPRPTPWASICVDSTTLRAHQHAAGAAAHGTGCALAASLAAGRPCPSMTTIALPINGLPTAETLRKIPPPYAHPDPEQDPVDHRPVITPASPYVGRPQANAAPAGPIQHSSDHPAPCLA